LQARQRELRAEIHRLNQDLLSQAVREALLKAQRDISERELALLDARQRHINEQLDRRCQAETEQTRHEAEVAQREAAGKHPLLGRLAARNARLTQDLSVLTAALDGIGEQQAQAVAATKRIGDEFRRTPNKWS